MIGFVDLITIILVVMILYMKSATPERFRHPWFGGVTKLDELDKLQEELCVTLCLLEKHFPPSFFDVMIHLTVHLTREVKL